MQERQLQCPECSRTFDVSTDLSWIQTRSYFYLLENGHKEPVHTEKKWCLNCQKPTDCECLPNLPELHKKLLSYSTEAQAIERKLLSFTKANQQQLRIIKSRTEGVQRLIAVFQYRKSPSRCLECGDTQVLEFVLPAFHPQTQCTIGFLHPGCTEPMVLIDGNESSLHVSLSGSPQDITTEREILVTYEGRLVEQMHIRPRVTNFGRQKHQDQGVGHEMTLPKKRQDSENPESDFDEIGEIIREGLKAQLARKDNPNAPNSETDTGSGRPSTLVSHKLMRTGIGSRRGPPEDNS
jgi:hypothetical protein